MPASPDLIPALLAPDTDAARLVIDFFTAHIRNPHTRKQPVAVD